MFNRNDCPKHLYECKAVVLGFFADMYLISLFLVYISSGYKIIHPVTVEGILGNWFKSRFYRYSFPMNFGVKFRESRFVRYKTTYKFRVALQSRLVVKDFFFFFLTITIELW